MGLGAIEPGLELIDLAESWQLYDREPGRPAKPSPELRAYRLG